MKLHCLNCGHEFDGSISYDRLGWHSTCPECGGSFDVDLPSGRYYVSVSSIVDDGSSRFGKELEDYRTFDTPEELLTGWKEMLKRYEGLWHWTSSNSPDGVCLAGVMDTWDYNELVEQLKYEAEYRRKETEE